MKPTLSILLPAYNASHFIEQTLDSILCQTFSDFELLAADDGSSDNTRQILEKYAEEDSRIKLMHNDSNRGKTFTVNRLWKASSGQYITIHDADDISMPGRFEKQFEEFNLNPALGMCGTRYIRIDEAGDFIRYVDVPLTYEDIKIGIRYDAAFHGCTMIFKREIAEELKILYRPYFKDDNEDCDLAYRIIEKFHSCNIDEYLYQYRAVNSSLTNVTKLNPKEVISMYRVVVHLADQRAILGVDDVEAGNEKALDDFIIKNKLRLIDQSKEHIISFYIKRIKRFGYLGLYYNALKTSFSLVRLSPLYLSSWIVVIKYLLLFIKKRSIDRFVK